MKELFKNIKLKIKFFFENLFHEEIEIMMVSIDLTKNRMVCLNFCGEHIDSLPKDFTEQSFETLKPYCRLSEDYYPVPTRIYIWTGMETKHLAYGEPIKNYFENKSLLKTGQGYHFGSGKRYDGYVTKKCHKCGQTIKK